MKYTNYQQFIHTKVVGQYLFFYLMEADKSTFLFAQRYYAGVHEFFRKDISIPLLLRHKRGKDRMVDHVLDKLPRYITYAEKYAA